MEKTINKDNINSFIELLEWKPMNTDIIVSYNEIEQEGELNLSNNTITQTQLVLAVGSMVRDIKVGDEIVLDMDKLTSQYRNTRDAESPVIMLNVFPVELKDGTVTICIPSSAVKLVRVK